LVTKKIITESSRQIGYALIWKKNENRKELQKEFIYYVQDCLEEERKGTQPYLLPEREYIPPKDTAFL
ncbi:MAG: hypothetical protein J5949_08245, partial [Oscillospiraceae bacterium]|nr:hypothetical protein [Oscillospiraceae bacterium]